MTDAAIRPAGTGAAPAPGPAHPLDPVTAEEYRAGRDVLARAGLLTGQVRFAYYGLEEPPKAEVLAFAAAAGTGAGGAAGGGANGAPPDRRLRAFLVNVVTGESTDAVLSLASQKVLSARTLDPRRDGHLPILDQDFALCDQIVHADEGWRAAMARRGLTDVSKIRVCPLTAGHYDDPDEDGRRMVRVLAFVQNDKSDLPWAHPVDGVAAYVDLIERKVFRVIDALDLAVPQESGDYDDPAVRGPLRTGLRPIEITQPDGPSFTLDGQTLDWQGWSMRIGFDAREGLSLHQISLDGRPVVYRASIAEMVVPYGGPSPALPLAELLRHRRVPGRQVGQFAGARLRLPGGNRLPARHRHRRRRRAPRGRQCDLHPRGGLRHPLEAHRHLHRLGPGPAPAPPGGLVLHHRRQLRLRLLLVLLPRRHDRVRDQAHRRGVHLGLPGPRLPLRRGSRSRPRRARASAPVQRAARHDGRRPGQRGRGGRHRPRPGRPGQPAGQRAAPARDPASERVPGGPGRRAGAGQDLAGGQHGEGEPFRPGNRFRTLAGGRAHPAGQSRIDAVRPGPVRHSPPVGDQV